LPSLQHEFAFAAERDFAQRALDQRSKRRHAAEMHGERSALVLEVQPFMPRLEPRERAARSCAGESIGALQCDARRSRAGSSAPCWPAIARCKGANSSSRSATERPADERQRALREALQTSEHFDEQRVDVHCARMLGELDQRPVDVEEERPAIRELRQRHSRRLGSAP
jgi:hypothetical protein